MVEPFGHGCVTLREDRTHAETADLVTTECFDTVATQSETADCVATVSKHSVVTKSAVSACVRSSLKVTHPCPKGSTIFVVKNETTYALRSGARPIRLPKHASLV